MAADPSSSKTYREKPPPVEDDDEDEDLDDLDGELTMFSKPLLS